MSVNCSFKLHPKIVPIVMYWLLSDTDLSPSPNSNYCQISNLVQESYLLYTVCMHILECMFFVLDVLISLWIKILLHSWIKLGFQCDFQCNVIPLLQVPSSGHKQTLKIQGMSPSPTLTTHPAAPPVAVSPQPSHSPLTLSQQIQSPHQQQQSHPPSQPQPQSQTPSRSCTPSSHPPLFIVHNQIAESPQTAPQGQTQPQQTHIQVQLQPQLQPQPQPRPASQPAPYQQEMPPMSQSPKPPPAPPAQHQFTSPPVSTSATAVVKAQVPIPGLTAEQQHHLQLVGAQIQTLSGITQPSPQQKQLLDKLHQVLSLLTTYFT